MLDIKFIKENRKLIQTTLDNKNVSVDLDKLFLLDNDLKNLDREVMDLNARRNELAQKSKSTKPTPEIIQAGKELKEKSSSLEAELTQKRLEFTQLLYKVPNIYSDDTPIGKDDTENVVLRTWGNIPDFSFEPKDHIELGKILDIIDIETSATIAGSRFNYLKNEAVLLEFALVQLVMTTLVNQTILQKIIKDNNLDISAKPFVPVVPPVMIRPDIFARMGRLTDEDKDDKYYLPEDDLYLVGSAEHTIGPIHIDTKLEERELPKRYIGFSTAFRRESGSYGKDVKGILRVHQFDKLEMEVFSTPETGLAEQSLLVAIQEYLMQELEIPYQVVSVCTGDMGKPDFRQVDIETWIPSQKKYRETHSSDYMTDYQSRRLKTKVKLENGNTEFIHMNDATAFAIGRILIAILENNQQADGSVVIPKVLQPYVGVDVIQPRN